MAKLYSCQKSAFALVMLLVGSRASAQESLVALPSSVASFPHAAVTGFTQNEDADVSPYIQDEGSFPPTAGWVATLWIVLDDQWRAEHGTETSIRITHELDGVVYSGVGKSYVVDISGQAAARSVFIGGEARIAYRARVLGDYSSGNHTWQFWGPRTDASFTVRQVEWFVIQFRIDAAVDPEGEPVHTGVTVTPPGVSLDDPDAFTDFDDERNYYDINPTSQQRKTVIEGYINEPLGSAAWGAYVGAPGGESLLEDYWDVPGSDIAANRFLYSVPVFGHSNVNLNFHPSNLEPAMSAVNTEWHGWWDLFRVAIRRLCLAWLYWSAFRRVFHILSVS